MPGLHGGITITLQLGGARRCFVSVCSSSSSDFVGFRPAADGLDLLLPIDVVEMTEEDGSMHKVGAFLVGSLRSSFVSVPVVFVGKAPARLICV